jgi:hypothetical protein
MHVSEAILSQRDAMLAAMLELRDRSTAPSPDDARQLMRGFVHLLAAAATGNFGPRDEYLSVVIPGMRASGFPLSATLDSMVRVAIALTATLEREHHVWLSEFCGDYARRLLRAWEAAAP